MALTKMAVRNAKARENGGNYSLSLSLSLSLPLSPMAMGGMTGFPIPFAPQGAVDSGSSTMTFSISIMSIAVRSRCFERR